MEDEGNLLSRMRKIFSGEMEEGEDAAEAVMDMVDEIGRASCRERVYVLV